MTEIEIQGKLIIIRGPLGIGKTTIAKRIADKIKGEYFSIDDVLAEINLDHVDEEEGCIPLKNFLKVNQIIKPKIKSLIDNKISVIVDGNFYHKLQIEDLTRGFEKDSVVFSLVAPLDICIERDAARPNSHGKEAAEAVYNLVSRFNYGQIIDTNNMSIDQIVLQIISLIKNE